MGEAEGKAYLTDVSDEEWVFVLPYLLLSREDNRSRQHDLRALFNGVRSIVKTGKSVAHDAARSSAMAGGVPADAALDEGRLLRASG